MLDGMHMNGRSALQRAQYLNEARDHTGGLARHDTRTCTGSQLKQPLQLERWRIALQPVHVAQA
jgi:hypothetical protein